ncbi:MAG: T9SS type A sorting domain-containing protein [Ignavibacteriae bacterium]|nr:T9SS type A sorting domain-containing protein [Ignavibacteriota bacterium]
MKIILFFTALLWLNSLTVFAQHEADNWYFGDKAGLSFKNGSPSPLTDGQLSSTDASAVMSDKKTGKLLFYTDGSTIWNGNHIIVNNGTDLMGGKGGSQSALIVPNPANCLEYYIFTVPDLNPNHTPTTGNMYYSLISVENPDCEVIFKNRVLVTGVCDKLTGTLDNTETGFWVVSHHRTDRIFYSYHVTAQGVNETPVVSTVGEPAFFIIGCMKFSPNGAKLAIASHSEVAPLGLFDFNRASGYVSGYVELKNPTVSVDAQFYGVSFSQDNTKLYASGLALQGATSYSSAITQFEVNLQTASAIQNSAVVFFVRLPIPSPAALQLAPDGKLYISSVNKSYIDVINNPNLKGTACDYREDAVSLTKECLIGLPNFMDYIFGNHYLIENNGIFKQEISICDGSSIKIGIPSKPQYSYLWTPTEGLDNPNISNPTAKPAITTEYKLKISNAPICASNYLYLVNVTSVKASVESVQPICSGSSVQLSASGGARYTWSPSTGLDTVTKANPIAKPKVTTLYKVVVSENNCSDSAFVNVVVFPEFTANAGIDKSICSNEQVQIGDTAQQGESYSWTPTKGLNDPTLSNPIATVDTTTKYILEVKRNGCFVYDTAVIAVRNLKPIISKDVTICKGTSVKLISGGGKTYSWSPSAGLSNSKIATPIASPNSTTKYRVLVSNGNCIDSAFVTVTVIPFLSPDAGEDKVVCLGSSIRLGGEPETGITYSWQPDLNLDDPTKANPICTPNKSTQYILNVTNSSGCIGYDTILVSIKSISGNAGINKTVCIGAGTELGLLPETGSTYSWLPTANLDDATKSNPIATPITTTEYIIKVTDKDGCVGYDTVLIMVTNNLTAMVSGDTSICLGSSVQLTARGGSEYKWFPSIGLDNPNIPNPIASPDIKTTYSVIVSSGTCRDTTEVTVTINPPGKANAGPDQASCSGEIIRLGTAPEPGNTYRWQPEDGLDDPSKSNPIASPLILTTYILTVTNGSGCMASDTVIISPGQLKAIVSEDTVVCIGSSVRLSANGGSNYIWSPPDGLDNPTISNPYCSAISSTQYKVIVSSGTCVDTGYVTVDVVPVPTANAGEDRGICAGESTTIGSSEVAGCIYLWQPQTGLSELSESMTTVNPTVSTSYILSVTNSSGCEKTDTVTVTVNPLNERLFTLNPSSITFEPGKPFETSLKIPSDVQSWKALIGYDNQLMKYAAILQMTNGISATAIESDGMLTVNGTGENGNVILGFNTFLPHSPDTLFAMKLTVDTSFMKPCEIHLSQGNTLQLSDFCGRRLRSVSSTGKNYFLNNKENGINFGVGLSGNVRLELYDYTGILKEVLVDGTLDAGEYSIDFDLSTGMYFCRISTGMFDDVQKVVITH